MVVNFNPVCGRPVLPKSADADVQKRREAQRVPETEKKAKCGRKPLPPSTDPKVQARREKARANAEKKREGVKQIKASGMINQAIKMKIARKNLNDAKPKPSQTPFDKVKIIAKFLKDKLVLNKNTLQNRINRYNIITKALSELTKEDCLEKKGTGFTIRNIVNLEKKIGTKSKFGAIYLTSLRNVLGSFPIASKVMPDTTDNLLETLLMKRITDTIILTGKSKHFTIMYKYSSCKDANVNVKKRLVDYNELCNGDLKTLMLDKDILSDEEHMYNLLLQAFISIATFHNVVGYVHTDCHYGNFLYQLNNETGYYHYKAGTVDFYLKSCPHNLLIYDFGMSKQVQKDFKYVRYINDDYERIINAFMSKNNGWGTYRDLPTLDFDNKIINIKKIMNDIVYVTLSTFTNRETPASFRQSYFIKLFDIFKQTTPTGMIVTNRPTNVINTQPFIIFN